MIRLYAYVGDVSEEQLDFLIDNLEEEWDDDQDYYLNKDMIATLAQRGADQSLLDLLGKALGTQEDVDILWVDTDAEEEEEEDN